MSDVVGYRVAMQEERSAALRDRVQQLLAPLDGSERVARQRLWSGSVRVRDRSVRRERRRASICRRISSLRARELAPANCELTSAMRRRCRSSTAHSTSSAACGFSTTRIDPELIVSELARVTRPGGRILLVDQLGYVDPVVSAETDRFEQARDPSHTRLLPDQDIRGYLDANDLEVLTNEVAREQRNLERYLDLVGLEGDERRRVSGMAPGAVYEVEIGWYVARKRGGLVLGARHSLDHRSDRLAPMR